MIGHFLEFVPSGSRLVALVAIGLFVGLLLQLERMRLRRNAAGAAKEDFGKTAIEPIGPEDELDMSDAESLRELSELVGRASQREAKEAQLAQEQNEEKCAERAKEEEQREEYRNFAAHESAILLQGDVLASKDEKTIIRDLLVAIRGGSKEDDKTEATKEKRNVLGEIVKKFEKVEVRGSQKLIEVHTFSYAVLELINALDALGGWLPVHSFLRNDIINNVRKINLACKAQQAPTLQDMVSLEMETNTDWGDSGREALLWLKRTLQFVRRMLLYCVEAPDDSLAKNVQRAYREALAPCHNWAVRPVFGLCLRAMPNKDSFLDRLGSSEQEVDKLIRRFLEFCNPILSEIVTHFNETKLEDVVRLHI